MKKRDGIPRSDGRYRHHARTCAHANTGWDGTGWDGIPRARARRRLLDLHEHERGDACPLGVEGELAELGERAEAVVDDASHLLVPRARVVAPDEVAPVEMVFGGVVKGDVLGGGGGEAPLRQEFALVDVERAAYRERRAGERGEADHRVFRLVSG
jgi:hypothetical protein